MSRFLSTGLSTLSSIRNQLTEFTTEVLNESTQEVNDPVTELSVAKKRVADLEQLLATRNSEVEKLRAANSELEERAHVFEYQLRQVNERHKEAIDEKEAEILRLQSISLSDVPASSTATQRLVRDSTDDEFSPPFSPSTSDFEARKLKDEIKQLRAECQHWKQLVKRDQDESQKSTGGDETGRLRAQVMDLQRKLDELVENHQHELAALQEVHRSQLASMAQSYENKQQRQGGQENDDGWGAGADWENDDWSATSAAGDPSQKAPQPVQSPSHPAAELPTFDPQEKLDLENRLSNLQLENKRLHKLVDDLRKDDTELSRLQDENAELQRSLEDLDAEHASAVDKLLSDRKQAESVANELKKELAAVKEELAKADSQKTVDEGTVHGEENERLRTELQKATDIIAQLQTETTDLSQRLEQAALDRQEALEKQNAAYESQLHELNSRLRHAQEEKSRLRDQIDQLTVQCRELNVAYEDLNSQFEREKVESGAIVGSNHELIRKLEALKNDLTEYEEKYEKCKRDNLQAMKQLETLTNELERLKMEYFNASAAQVQSKKWHSEIVRLSKELEESLKKREELVKSVQDFQNVVDRFDQQIQRFRSENEQLKRENEELRVASGASSPHDFRRVFEDTDQELQILRRSLSEYQDTFLKKEKVWRDQMEALKEENEALKTRTPSTPGSGRDSDSGEASSSGSTSYVRIEMTHVDRSASGMGDNAQQPSPQGSNESGGLLVDQTLRRESQDLIMVDDDAHAMKSVIEQQRLTIHQLEERNRRLKTQILQLTTQNPTAFQDDHQSEPQDTTKLQFGEESDNGGWNDWGEDAEQDRKEEEATEIELEATKPKSAFALRESDLASTEMSKENLQQQLKEILEALNEKTDECEKLNQELEQKRRDVKEREELVQQVFTELKGLELQLADNRKREEELRSEVTKLTVDLHRQKEEMEQTRETMDKAHLVTENDLESIKLEKQKLETNLDQAQKDLAEARETEKRLQAELSQLRSTLATNASEINVEYESLKANYDQLRQEAENFEMQNGDLRRECDQLKSTFEEAKVRNQAELDRLTLDFENRLQQQTQEFENQRSRIDRDLQSNAHELENWRRTEQDFKAYREEMEKTLTSQSANLETLSNEKQQLIVLLNQKHQENVNYHQECQRLAHSLAEEQTKLQVLTRKAESASQKPPCSDFQSQTEEKTDEEKERMKMRLHEVESFLETSRRELDQKSQQLMQLENQLKNEVVEREASIRRELTQAIQDKDRAVGEMAASRQHSETLQQQLRLSEDACQRQTKEIERLRAHLLQIEEAYTQEAVKAEERETELRRRLRDAEQQLESDLEYAKDGNRKMADQLSDLRVQLESMAEQRDVALLQYADSQIELEKQQKALANLQTILQHLQQERDALISNEVKRYKQEANSVREQKRQLEQQLREVQGQLSEYQEKLNAASALFEHANAKEKMVSDLKAEINAKDDQCAMLQSKLNELQRIRDAKIDKDVLKNIFLGYFCAPTNKKAEVAHLLGAILGFSDDEFKKIEHGAGSGGWLQFLRLGGGPQAHGRSAEQSIAAQFIKFLETESTPKSPAVPMSTAFASDQRSMTPGFAIGASPLVENRAAASTTSRSSTPGLNLELPTFASHMVGGAGGSSGSASSGAAGSSDFLRDLLSKSGSDNVV